MSEGSAKTKMQQMIEEAQGQTGAKRKTSATATTATATQIKRNEKYSDIEGNTFFKIVFGEATPEEKKAAVTAALTFNVEDGKEKNAERLKEFSVFKEYLQEERKMLAQEIIKMTDTGAFSELKSVIDELNNGLLDFDNRMLPLTQIIDAVYKLRMAGGETVLGVFQEIKEDAAAEEERKRQLAETEAKLNALKQDINAKSVDIDVMSNSRSGEYRKFFGLGGLKESTLRAIAEKKLALENAQGEVAATTTTLQELSDPNKARETKYAEFIQEKAKLRELLDISSEQHKERQKGLVNAAQTFVSSTDERVGQVLTHLDGMTGQIDNLFDANNGMRAIYTIITDASKDATLKNQEVRSALDAPADKQETEIEKMSRESKQMYVEDHISTLGTSTVETVKTLGDLANQGVRIKSMKDANRQQVSSTRELHSSGVAGVADRLSMVLQAVNAAALNESSEAAKMAVNTMNGKTNAITAQEAIRTAVGLKDVADGLNRAIDEMVEYKELTDTTSKITREHLSTIADAVDRAKDEAVRVQESLRNSIGAQADVNAGAPSNDDKAAAAPAKKAETGSPFAKFGQ